VISKKRLEAAQRELCSELGPDDGLDPRLRGRHRDPHSNIRDLRLCGEVARILSLELDDVLVERVEPAPDATRLRVWVQTDNLEALERQRPRLRAAVAAAIRRKRAPDLVFAVVPA
jgi:hypothetical protein